MKKIIKIVKIKKAVITKIFIALGIVAILTTIVIKNLKQQTVEVNCQVVRVSVNLVEKVCDVKIAKTFFGKVLYYLD